MARYDHEYNKAGKDALADAAIGFIHTL